MGLLELKQTTVVTESRLPKHWLGCNIVGTVQGFLVYITSYGIYLVLSATLDFEF